MSLSDTAKAIIDKLNKGGCHNGQGLADDIGITRNAIWKQIENLKAKGLEIRSDKQRGYELVTPFIPLDSKMIKPYLTDRVIEQDIHWHFFADIDSTNRYLKSRYLALNQWEICLAEQQTSGRGRFNRDWYSPFGQNIYCSLSWMFLGDSSELSGLSLVVGLMILNALVDYGLDAQALAIKWPNDIYYYDKKIAGILIELSAESHHQTQVVIGIGLNVNMNRAKLIKSWTSICLETGEVHDRNVIVAHLINSLCLCLKDYNQEKKVTFLKAWQMYDYLYNQSISVTKHDNQIAGIAKGINEQGDLIIELANGESITCSSGEASLKREK